MNISARNNVKILGQGDTTLLFAHGFGCDQNMWRFVVPALTDRYKVVLFDYVGCGNSDLSAYNPERYSSLDGYAQDVIEICESLSLTDVIFVAHSVSCMIGAIASIRFPKIFDAMVWIGPSPKYVNDFGYVGGFDRVDIEDLLDVMDKNYIGWANFLAPVVMKNGERPELTQELESSFCSTDPAMTRRFAQVTFLSDNRNDLVKIAVPTLVMQCSDDSISPEIVGEYVQGKLQNGKLVKMDATGHCPHLSHPDETVLILSTFLSTLEAQAK